MTEEMSATSTEPELKPPPAGSLPPSVVQRGLRLSVAEGAVSTVYVGVITGVFLTGLALLLGANTFALGVIGALPFVGQLFQFVGAYLEERLGSRRTLVMVSALAARGLWLPIIMLLFLPVGALGLPLFLLLLGASYALGGVVTNAWLSWMSDLVPVRQRGRYFGFRNTVAGAVMMVVTYGAGLVADFYKARGQEALGYGLIFGVAVLFGVVGALMLRWQPEPALQRKERVRVGELFAAPLRSPRFRTFAWASAGWALATGIAAPFFNAFGIEILRISFSTLALTAILTSGVSLLTQPYIGRLQDRVGDRVVMVVCMFGVVLLPFGWILSTPTNIFPLWCTSFFAGVFWPGITQGMLNVLMDRSDPAGRGAFLAAYGAITGVGTFVAGLLGGVLATAFTGLTLPLGPITLDHYTLLFALSALGRLVVAVVFWRRL